VARDRKRAKQRRNRRDSAAARRGPGGAQALPPSQPARSDLPGALDHASGDVDEFDAALVRGAGGLAATPESGVGDAEPDPQDAGPDLQDAESGLQDGLPAAAADELQAPETPARPGAGDGGAGGGAGGDGGEGDGDQERPSGAPLRGGNRALAFLRASWAELQRVQWPDRRQVTQATAVVLGFVAIAGLYLGVADYVAKEIVELVL
jgi:preprotein translocase subunit SecE